MNKRPGSILIAVSIQVLIFAVCMLCLQSCKWKKRNKTDIFPIEIPPCEPSDDGPLWPPEMDSVHGIYDSLMMVYSETDSNRVIYDPGSILVEAMEIESLRNKTE